MPNQYTNFVAEAAACWEEGRPLESGKLIFENIVPKLRPFWAANILSLLAERGQIKSEVVEPIIQIAARPSDWHKAHDAFTKVRETALHIVQIGLQQSVEQKLFYELLLLAEYVAKVVYNASNPDDEFDEDSGWWIAVCLKDILNLICDDDFSRAMWVALTSTSNLH